MGDFMPFTPPDANAPAPEQGATPNAGTPAGAGDSAEWDVTTLEGAADQLDRYADYVGEFILPRNMQNGIRDYLTGGIGGNGTSPFGSYPAAVEMAQRQLGHYDRAEAVVTAVAERLRQAAETLREVKKKYETTEEANEMTAAAFDRLFAGEAAASMGRYTYDTAVPATGQV